MSEKMSIWGIGGKLAVFTGIFAIIIFITNYFYNSLFFIEIIPSIILNIAGIIFLLIGIPFQIISAKTISKVYAEGGLYTKGVYSVCRNPLYAGYIFFLIPGITFFMQSWLLFSIPVAMYFIFNNIIIEEEIFLEKEFGEDYLNYTKKVNRVFPKLWKLFNL